MPQGETNVTLAGELSHRPPPMNKFTYHVRVSKADTLVSGCLKLRLEPASEGYYISTNASRCLLRSILRPSGHMRQQTQLPDENF